MKTVKSYVWRNAEFSGGSLFISRLQPIELFAGLKIAPDMLPVSDKDDLFKDIEIGFGECYQVELTTSVSVIKKVEEEKEVENE